MILANGAYTVMDRLAEKAGGAGPWPGLEGLEVATIARSFGCDARRIVTHDELTSALDEAVATLAERDEPLLLDVEIAPTPTFRP